jgi:hypothetical protein
MMYVDVCAAVWNPSGRGDKNMRSPAEVEAPRTQGAAQGRLDEGGAGGSSAGGDHFDRSADCGRLHMGSWKRLNNKLYLHNKLAQNTAEK